MDKYEDLLERAIDQLPPEVFEHKRFKIPKAYSDIQGNRTFIKNFKEVSEGLNRDPQHLLKFLMRELKIMWTNTLFVTNVTDQTLKL